MTFLPIAQRELRLASRRKGTFVIRCLAALVGMMLAAFGLMMAVLSPGAGGRYVFTCTSYYLFIMALFGGVFLASDCLSRERREGTLGFLFLTDLKGHDVVLGKFVAISLNAFYGLLATFPMLGLSVLMGSVNMPEFARMSLALLNTLFFSVCGAIWVSSRTVSAYRAMTSAVGLVLGLLALAVVAHIFWTMMPARWAHYLHVVTVLSPVESFLLAGEAGYLGEAGHFWMALGVSHALAWVFLLLACWRLPNAISTEEASGFWRRLITGNLLAVRSRRRRRLLEIQPVLWLVDDARGMRWVAWVLAVSGAVLIFIIGPTEPPMIVFMAWPFFTLLKLFFTVQACRFFSEARRTGTLELLCVTPMATSNLLDGQWTALRKNFLWPIVLLLSAGITMLIAANSTDMDFIFEGGLIFFYQTAKVIADFFALGWAGMWLALTVKRPEMATGLTILFVMLLPSVAFCVPTLITDVIFIVLGSAFTINRLRNPSSIAR
jgi:ABC-type transport system involved in multi-copper enzyme maturation permease subunit